MMITGLDEMKMDSVPGPPPDRSRARTRAMWAMSKYLGISRAGYDVILIMLAVACHTGSMARAIQW